MTNLERSNTLLQDRLTIMENNQRMMAGLLLQMQDSNVAPLTSTKSQVKPSAPHHTPEAPNQAPAVPHPESVEPHPELAEPRSEAAEPHPEVENLPADLSFEVNLPSLSRTVPVQTTAAAEKENTAPKVTIPRISTKDDKFLWTVRDPDAADKCLALRRKHSGSFKTLARELLLEIADPRDLINRNCNGAREKEAIPKHYIDKVKSTMHKVLPQTINQSATGIMNWKQCVHAIDEYLRRNPDKYKNTIVDRIRVNRI